MIHLESNWKKSNPGFPIWIEVLKGKGDCFGSTQSCQTYVAT